MNKWTLALSTLVLACLFVTAINFNSDHYMLLVLTLVASFSSILYLLPLYLNTKSLTLLFFLICSFLKYIITPLFYSIAPISSFSYYSCTSNELFNRGVVLMLYEFVILSIFISYYATKTLKTDRLDIAKQLVSGSNNGVLLFVLVAFVVFFTFPESHTGLSFFILDSNTGTRVSSIETNSLIVLTREIVLIGIYSTFVIVSVYCCRKSLNSSSSKYMIIALIIALLITMIIVSEARSSQIYCGFACLMLLSALFPSQKKRITVSLTVTIGIVVVLLSIYKTFYAFKYSSYGDAIDAASINMNTITYNLEVYCLGPLHYSSVIELASNNSFPLSRLAYGFLRSVMGTNLLVKSIDMETTSMVFNKYVTANRADTGYLLPITGLGYLYLKSILSPLFSLSVYYLAFKMEKVINNSKSAFVLFFSSYIYIRLATCIICTNINTILSMGSMIIWSAGAIFLFNKLMTVRNKV